ncbi:MAG: cytochrome b5 domain-containing protein [Candidatus Bathyarchaeia archaeon]|jgi:predicted heme/steroid binding protein
MVDLTLDELKKSNGKNGNPSYLAYKGVIYDVSDSTWFTDGEHFDIHSCGQDLTEEISEAPHDDDVFSNIQKIGKLI